MRLRVQHSVSIFPAGFVGPPLAGAPLRPQSQSAVRTRGATLQDHQYRLGAIRWLVEGSTITLPVRHTASLRRARISIPSARYFLTLCTLNREHVLAGPRNAERIIATWLELAASGDIKLLAATVMPDHIHALFGWAIACH